MAMQHFGNSMIYLSWMDSNSARKGQNELPVHFKQDQVIRGILQEKWKTIVVHESLP
jgi:hypothetical protein